jgi:hypothetical protein
MRPSRGMGDINPSKVPKMGIKSPKVGTRKDGDKFDMYSGGGKTKSRVNEAGNYTKPELRKRIFNRIKAGGKGGNPGQWSARKAQMLAQAVQGQRWWRTGTNMKAPQKSLKDWGDQKWRTSDGSPSKGKKRYLPDAAWSALSPAEKAATNKAKAAGNKKGKQFVAQPKKVAQKVKGYRK